MHGPGEICTVIEIYENMRELLLQQAISDAVPCKFQRRKSSTRSMLILYVCVYVLLFNVHIIKYCMYVARHAKHARPDEEHEHARHSSTGA